jgi:CubicO group peptidase (beta-lactamase class C family)
MCKILLPAVLLLGIGSFSAAEGPSDLPARAALADSITSQLDRLLAAKDKPGSVGCALGVMHDGKLIYSRCLGMADLEHGALLSEHSALDIASISKQFTAMAILLLVQQGKISLDDDVRKYVPETPDYGVTITLRHLLHHTSGLRNHFLLRQLEGWRWGDLECRADELAIVARQRELNFKPGEEHSYTNTGYFLLGEVVGRVSGKSLREFVDQNIFKPLGMNDSLVQDDVSLLVKNRAWGYHADKRRGWVNNMTRPETVGGSNVYTSIADMARWDQNFYDCKVGGAALIADMVKPGVLTNGSTLSYAAGLRVGSHKGLKLVWHAGSSSCQSEYLRFPDQHFSVFCFCNMGDIDPSALARQVADICLADVLKPEPTMKAPEPEEQAKGLAEVADFIKKHAIGVSERELSGLAGLYMNTDNGGLRRVRMKDGKLFVERGPGVESELVPIGEQRFLMAKMPIKLEVSFKEPWPGTRFMSIFTGKGNPLGLVYVGPDVGVPSQIAQYEGTFRCDEADATVTTVIEGGKLVLRTRGFEKPEPARDPSIIRGSFPLEPVRRDAFKNNWIGLLRFTRNAGNQITGFAVSNFAGGVRHLQFQKGREQFVLESGQK